VWHVCMGGMCHGWHVSEQALADICRRVSQVTLAAYPSHALCHCYPLYGNVSVWPCDGMVISSRLRPLPPASWLVVWCHERCAAAVIGMSA